MAIDARNLGDKKYTIAEQSVFGTAEADSAAGIELDIEPVSINPDIKVREHPGVHGARWRQAADLQTDMKGAIPSFTLAGPARNPIDHLLHAFFQSVTEGATTPFDKTFVLHSTQPDFSVSAGHFLTLIEHKGAAESWKVGSSICSSLNLTLSVGELLQFSAEMMGMGSVTSNSSPSGTYTRSQGNKWHFEDLDIFTVDFGAGAQALTLTGFDISLTQELTPVGPDGSGSYQTFHLSQKLGTFKLNTLEDVNTVTAMTNASADTAVTARIGWGNATPGTDDGDFDIQFTGKIENVVPGNDDLRQTEISGRIAATGATSPITIVMANAVDRTW